MLYKRFKNALRIGLDDSLQIRREIVSKHVDACRLVYISDIHLRRGRSERLSQQVVRAARDSDADVILLGGDLLDSASELGHLSELISRLTSLAPVLAVGGNHDQTIGLGRVQEVVEQAGGRWIHRSTYSHRHAGRMINISGPEAQDEGVAKDDGIVHVLCGHHPRLWKRAKGKGYDLVLAGHLHGCQAVAFTSRGRLFPGALFYSCCYLSTRHGASRFVVSRGVSDLIPIRWRCPREVVVCHV